MPKTTDIRNRMVTLVGGVSGLALVLEGRRDRLDLQSYEEGPIAIVAWGPIQSILEGGKARRRRREGSLIVELVSSVVPVEGDDDQDLFRQAEISLDTLGSAVENATEADPKLNSTCDIQYVESFERNVDIEGDTVVYFLTITYQVIWYE